LKAQAVDVVVLDFEMPVMDGIEFLRLIGRTYPGLKVVMLSARLDEHARKTSMELGAALYLEKPTTLEGFKAVFGALDALVSTGPQSGFRGMMQVGLQDVLQMECLGRKSSIVGVQAAARRGQIYICNGEIIHAEAGPMQGEMALYGLLGLAGGEFSMLPYAEPKRRTISGSYEFLLMEAARMRDEGSSQARLPGSLGTSTGLQAALDNTTRTEARGIRIEEALLCSSTGEVLYQWKCEDIDNRLEVFKRIEQQALMATKGMPSGRFHRLSMDVGESRVLIQIQPTYKLLVRSALPPANNSNNGTHHE
jgi:CheY-like chemotaxis protein